MCDDTYTLGGIFRTRPNLVVGAGVPARPCVAVCENVGYINHPSSPPFLAVPARGRVRTPSPTTGEEGFLTHITPYYMATQGASRTPPPTGGRGTNVSTTIRSRSVWRRNGAPGTVRPTGVNLLPFYPFLLPGPCLGAPHNDGKPPGTSPGGLLRLYITFVAHCQRAQPAQREVSHCLRAQPGRLDGEAGVGGEAVGAVELAVGAAGEVFG